ncbi:MAG TPA: L-threonylcarbamoyladenylate synthase [Patescibacteria group bacterium]|nr:L-threonylcarbamoyladenylate synthase [Patescibacteria group bacterium]
MPQILNTLSDSALASLLLHGSVGVMPTDTVYGLVCQASNQTAVEHLYSLKAREHKPGTVIAANIDQLSDLGLKHRYVKAVEQFWPNPLSIIIPAGSELAYLHQAKGGLACRVVQGPPELVSLLEQTGALLTTSANLPAHKPADTLKEAQNYFGDNVNFYVEGGDLSGHQPSTLIRVVDDAIEVLRPGAINIDESGRIKT